MAGQRARCSRAVLVVERFIHEVVHALALRFVRLSPQCVTIALAVWQL
jgi:hypothetical protein